MAPGPQTVCFAIVWGVQRIGKNMRKAGSDPGNSVGGGPWHKPLETQRSPPLRPWKGPRGFEKMGFLEKVSFLKNVIFKQLFFEKNYF